MAVIHHSAAFQADAHSQAVAAATLSALVPAWLAAGRDSKLLWLNLLAALPGLPAIRRVGLMEALLTALPAVRVIDGPGLCWMWGMVGVVAVRVR